VINEERLLKVLVAPYVSEKASRVAANRQVVFRVVSDAAKPEIKKAAELLFKVKVDNVRICKVKGKNKMFGRVPGWRKGWRKAYLTLAEGQNIDFATQI
jgi:large subunit ribosomal protein L23